MMFSKRSILHIVAVCVAYLICSGQVHAQSISLDDAIWGLTSQPPPMPAVKWGRANGTIATPANSGIITYSLTVKFVRKVPGMADVEVTEMQGGSLNPTLANSKTWVTSNVTLPPPVGAPPAATDRWEVTAKVTFTSPKAGGGTVTLTVDAPETKYLDVPR